ncbi:MAG: MraY family glycosyltransferase [Limisphaerales bacterium]
MLAGAAAGFLPHNFPRARMFMGDVGSAPLGFLLASVALWIPVRDGWWLLVPLCLMHTNFVLDTAITLCRRVLRGERWHEAHREHFYQRLIRSGRSHSFVTGLEMGLQVLVFALLSAYIRVGVASRLALAVAVVLLWCGFFAYCESQFRRTQNCEATVAEPALK